MREITGVRITVYYTPVERFCGGEDPQEGDAHLVLDARRFLGFNPHDGEVRTALGRLPREYMYP